MVLGQGAWEWGGDGECFMPPILASHPLHSPPHSWQVSFPIVGDADGASLVAWTTTPWTLPSNVALCVHPELIYVKVREGRGKGARGCGGAGRGGRGGIGGGRGLGILLRKARRL